MVGGGGRPLYYRRQDRLLVESMSSAPISSAKIGPVAAAPEVSVLIPIYNGERFLAECLDSVLQQDFGSFEILIADDGSTDRSLEIVQSYAAKNPRIRWWQNPKNLGQTENHNACLREARGEFIKFIHQDDKFLSPSALGKMVRALKEHPAATLAGSASDVIDDASRPQELRLFYQAGVWNGKQIIRAGLEAVGNQIGEPTVVLFRKAQAVRGFVDSYKQLWDLEMWFYLLEQGDFVYLAEPLCAFRIHPAQQSNINRRNGVGQLEIGTLMAAYYAKPWMRALVTQRMLINYARFLKRNRAILGPRSDELLVEIKRQIRPLSYPLFWLDRKALRPYRKWKRRAREKARRRPPS